MRTLISAHDTGAGSGLVAATLKKPPKKNTAAAIATMIPIAPMSESSRMGASWWFNADGRTIAPRRKRVHAGSFTCARAHLSSGHHGVRRMPPLASVLCIVCWSVGAPAPDMAHEAGSIWYRHEVLSHGKHLLRLSTRSEEHTSELQSPYVISYAVFC